MGRAAGEAGREPSREGRSGGRSGGRLRARRRAAGSGMAAAAGRRRCEVGAACGDGAPRGSRLPHPRPPGKLRDPSGNPPGSLWGSLRGASGGGEGDAAVPQGAAGGEPPAFSQKAKGDSGKSAENMWKVGGSCGEGKAKGRRRIKPLEASGLVLRSP